jgi:outer membrane protein assembly factor BamA
VALSYTASIYNRLYDQSVVLDPSARSTAQPRDLFLGAVRAGWSYSNATATTYAVSNESGFRISASTQLAGRWSGSQASLAAFDARASLYFLAPWAAHHAFALTAAGGASGGSYPRGGYYFGGFAEQDILNAVTTGVAQSAFVIRGYPPGVFVGSQYNYGNAEYRFPILWIEHGVSTMPAFLDALSGALFADYGGAYDQLDLNDPFRQLHLGLGGELRLSLTLGYFLSSTVRLGWARGFGDLAPSYGRSYLAVAGSF